MTAFCLILSCSGDRPEGERQASLATQGGAGIEEKAMAPAVGERKGAYSLEIRPPEAARLSRFELVPTGFKLEEADAVWLLNGAPVSTPQIYSFDAGAIGVRKGDTVQARVRVGGIEVNSGVARVRNSPPELTSVRLVPEVFKPGDSIGLDVEAQDADGDRVTVEYRWTLNGRPAGSGGNLEGRVKRDDTFSVTVIPFDGEEHGREVSLTRIIGNLPPMFSQHSDYTFDGRLYTYRVKASDPDGDTLTYALKSAPEGMSMDPATGLVKWPVPEDFLGTAAFTVTAADGSGGQAEITLKFTMAPKEKGAGE